MILFTNAQQQQQQYIYLLYRHECFTGKYRIVCPRCSGVDFKVMVTPSSCRATSIHISDICGVVNIRIAVNYLVKLNQAKVFPSKLQCWPV